MTEVLGAFNYLGKHTTQQVKTIKSYFELLLEQENFDVIIEIGTSFGGLTYILSDIVQEKNLKNNIHTFDIGYRDYVEKELNDRNVIYHILDERDEVFKSTVVDLLTNHGKSLLLCDGGNKVEEFNRYSPFLKNEDIIMAHDYCHNYDTFINEMKDKHWNWLEISYSDIEESIKTLNLKEYSKTDFKFAAWACFQKS
jgi:cephalosporin hydroxylase